MPIQETIIITISPQSLKWIMPWFSMIHFLASNGLILSICIDEAHATVKNHDSFRSEFRMGIDSINELICCSNHHHPSRVLPTIIMSATFRILEQIAFSALKKKLPDILSGGSWTNLAVDTIVDLVNRNRGISVPVHFVRARKNLARRMADRRNLP